MQRLGEDPLKYYTDIVTANDRRVMELKDKLTYLLREKSEESDIAAEMLINELQLDKAFTEKINFQFLLMNKAILAFHRKDYSGMYNYAVEALNITKQNFDEDKIDTYVLLSNEIKLINQIAVAHSFLSSLEKSVNILLKLKASIDKSYFDEAEKIRTYITLLYNISKNLGLLKRYEECIHICDIGLELCQKHRNFFYYPMFQYNKAYYILHMRKKEEGIALLEKAYTLFAAYNRYAELSSIESHVDKEFGIKIQVFKTQHPNPSCNQSQFPVDSVPVVQL